MRPLSAQEAFWNWVIPFALTSAGVLLAICLAVSLIVFAKRRDDDRSRDD